MQTSSIKTTSVFKGHRRTFIPRLFPTYANVAADTYSANAYPSPAHRINWVSTTSSGQVRAAQLRGLFWGITTDLEPTQLGTSTVLTPTTFAPWITVYPMMTIYWEFKGISTV